MALLNVAPTKSNLLALRRQLAVAEEGYDLLEQKRQILVFELMSRMSRAQEVEQRAAAALEQAFAALQQATLDVGGEALDRAALAVRMDHRVEITSQRLMGLRIPHISVTIEPPSAHFGIGGTSASSDLAMRRFVEILPLLAELAALQQAVISLANELRKTQRRCNALSKTFIPTYRQTIAYIAGALEEREREMFATMKMLRARLEARRMAH